MIHDAAWRPWACLTEERGILRALGFLRIEPLLAEAGQGRPLEPVRVSISEDKKFVILDQRAPERPPAAFLSAAAWWISTGAWADAPDAASSIPGTNRANCC